MKPKIPPSVEELIYAQQHGLLEDLEGQAVMRLIDAGISDKFAQGLVTDRVRRHATAQAFAGPFATTRKLRTGKIILGLDLKGRQLRIPLQYFNGHTLVVSGSGGGKTVQARWFVLQVAQHLKGLWLFDLRKKEFAILKPLLARVGVELIVLPGRSLKLNPLQVPEAVDPTDWATRIADVLVTVLQLPQRAGKLIQTTILLMYRDFGVLKGGDSYPTLFDLRERIAADTKANAQARQAVIDSLDPVLLSIGSVLRWRRGWTADTLASHHIVFELGGLAETDKDLILNTLVLGVFASRIARNVSNARMNLWICCDEAGRLVSASSQTGGISDLIALVRGTGVGLYLATQSADLSPIVLSNTAIKFLGRCGSARDYDTIGGAMGLTAEQRHYLTQTLVPGMFAGQVGEGAWRRPFLFRIPEYDLRPPTPNSIGSGLGRLPGPQAREPDDPFADVAVEEAVVFRDWYPGIAASVTTRSTPTPEPATSSPSLCEAELRFLNAVIDHPGQPSGAYPPIAGIGAQRAQTIRQRLVQLGYLREHRVQTGGRGRAAIVLEPLEAVHAILDESDSQGAKT